MLRSMMMVAGLFLVACGDDTGGAGAGGGAGGGNTSSGEGGSGGGSTSSAGGGTTSSTGGTGGARGDVIAACEASEARNAAVAGELGCPDDGTTDCEGFADFAEGCEAEWIAVYECLDPSVTAETCSCDGAGGGAGLQCDVDSCQDLLDAAVGCE